MERLSSHHKILLLSSDLNVAGGLEKMVVSLANKLCQNEYNVSLLIISSNTKSFFPLNEKINIHSLKLDFGINPDHNWLRRKRDFISDIKKLKQKINKIAPDIIITTDYVQTSIVVSAGFSKSLPIISWQHSDYYQRKSRAWKVLSDNAYKKVQAIVCLNEDEAAIYKRFNRNVFIIPNFIEPVQEQSDLNKKRILTIGRLTENKGFDLMLQTASVILKKYTDWEWLIIGKGTQQQLIESFIKENNLQNLKLLSPPSADLSNYYLSASIYVMTSRIEPFGMVLIEAMNYGLPVVAFDCNNGPRHIITQSVDGSLVKKENAQKLIESIALLIENEIMRKEMGIAAKKNVQRFYSDNVIHEWKALLNRLSSTHPA
jgi:glycosyltransferase involved in cell wall biosynthesis